MLEYLHKKKLYTGILILETSTHNKENKIINN